MRRTVTPELLDQDAGTPAEIAATLADLRAINERFGGISTTLSLLERVVTRCVCRELTLLEVASGSGDLPLAAQRRLTDHGIHLRVTLLDRMASHLNGAPAAVCGEALRLPFCDGAFDVVSCSLFAHHLEPDELRSFVGEGLRVCRRAVLINDLIRSRLHLWLVYSALPLFRSRLTRHDAPVSVRRAYTMEEIRQLLRDMPNSVEISRHPLYRMGVLVWKEQPLALSS
ncbi:MAG TPA: methyltransferase domain-containing protein [Bryocella sp.]|nr:methyltransferase domain-containing protein [Bryocella sp.]